MPLNTYKKHQSSQVLATVQIEAQLPAFGKRLLVSGDLRDHSLYTSPALSLSLSRSLMSSSVVHLGKNAIRRCRRGQVGRSDIGRRLTHRQLRRIFQHVSDGDPHRSLASSIRLINCAVCGSLAAN